MGGHYNRQNVNKWVAGSEANYVFEFHGFRYMNDQNNHLGRKSYATNWLLTPVFKVKHAYGKANTLNTKELVKKWLMTLHKTTNEKGKDGKNGKKFSFRRICCPDKDYISNNRKHYINYWNLQTRYQGYDTW